MNLLISFNLVHFRFHATNGKISNNEKLRHKVNFEQENSTLSRIVTFN